MTPNFQVRNYKIRIKVICLNLITTCETPNAALHTTRHATLKLLDPCFKTLNMYLESYLGDISSCSMVAHIANLHKMCFDKCKVDMKRLACNITFLNLKHCIYE